MRAPGPTADPPFRTLPGWKRGLLSLAILFHLAAVAFPPLAFQARGPLGGSPSVQAFLTPVRGYGEFLYLNRGYAFFAPDAGPSHLIQVALTDDAGNVEERMYPDLGRDWPRLLYHRHFMLAEFLQDAYQPPLPPPSYAEEDPEAYEQWGRVRARYEAIRGSITNHLADRHPDHQVAIRRIEHLIPTFVEFNAAPTRLDDERFYSVLLDRALEEIPAAPDEGVMEEPDGPRSDRIPGEAR